MTCVYLEDPCGKQRVRDAGSDRMCSVGVRVDLRHLGVVVVAVTTVRVSTTVVERVVRPAHGIGVQMAPVDGVPVERPAYLWRVHGRRGVVGCRVQTSGVRDVSEGVTV